MKALTARPFVLGSAFHKMNESKPSLLDGWDGPAYEHRNIKVGGSRKAKGTCTMYKNLLTRTGFQVITFPSPYVNYRGWAR